MISQLASVFSRSHARVLTIRQPPCRIKVNGVLTLPPAAGGHNGEALHRACPNLPPDMRAALGRKSEQVLPDPGIFIFPNTPLRRKARFDPGDDAA